MRKAFKIILPDEPYVNTTAKNISVDAIYTGPRYLLVRFNDDGTLHGTDQYGDDRAEVEAFAVEEPGSYQVVMDADVNPFEAAYLTDEYTHGDIPNYVEALAGGGSYEYDYADGTGVIPQIYMSVDLRHDKHSNAFTSPRRRLHVITPKQFWDSVDAQIEFWTDRKSTEDYLPEEIVEIDAFITELGTLKARYADVAHWKVPFPNQPNL